MRAVVVRLARLRPALLAIAASPLVQLAGAHPPLAMGIANDVVAGAALLAYVLGWAPSPTPPASPPSPPSS